LTDFAPRGTLPQALNDSPPKNQEAQMADAAPMSDAERAKLEQRRDRLMKLMREGGDEMEADDRADLSQEWTRIDNLLNRR
jgi:hypothetical protein